MSLKLLTKEAITTQRTRSIKLNNKAEQILAELIEQKYDFSYAPLQWYIEKPDDGIDYVYLGQKVETEQEFNIPFTRLFKRSISVDGSSGSGKSTLVVRLIVEILQYEYIVIEGKELRVKLIIIDPDRDIYQVFSSDDRVEYIDISECDEAEAWAICADIFERSLKRPLVKDAEDIEIIIIEEAIEIAPEKGESKDDLTPEERAILNRCIRRYRQHARKARKRASISISVIQNPFDFRKSVLRQIKTHFVFQLEDKKQVLALSKPWLDAHASDIIEAEPGVCHAYGEGIPNRTNLFLTSQIDTLKTSDM